MSDEKAKAAAAAKAKAEAIRKMKERELEKEVQEKKEDNEKEAVTTKEDSETTEVTPSADEKAKAAAAAKAKAAAAAKAKAAALAKMKAQEEVEGKPGESDAAEASSAGEDEKAKAAAVAKAKAAAVAKAKAAAAAKLKAQGGAAGADDDEKAKAKAAAVAKAKAAAAAKAKAAGGDSATPEAVETKPSPNQPLLDKYIRVIKENLGEDVLEDAYINTLAKDVPTLVAKRECYYKLAQFLKHNEQLNFDYLSELHGTDFETHMEIYNHFYSFKTNENIALKVKIDRDQPEIESLASVWEGANWPEREAYDLLGIIFTGHPNLSRIMLSDDWVGHPLRKDYEQHDEEV